MYTPVDVRILIPVVIGDPVNDVPRFLGCCCIIEVNKKLFVNFVIQYREIVSYAV